jgi:hypothetical protein
VKVIYIGSGRAPVEIPSAGVVCEPGVPCEVPVAVARKLLEQTNTWKKFVPAKKE